MADNITAPAIGTVLASDDVDGVQYPRNKISFGAEGAAADVSTANPFPVAIPGALPLPAGAATAAGVAATASADDIFPVNPNDGTDLPTTPKALLVAVAGNLAVRGSSGTTVTIPVVVGQIVPLRVRRVMATGTTATVVGLA